MSSIENLITNHIEVWTSTVKTKSSAGRGNNAKRELYGIKRLRELIFELAARGLLTPQITDDEPVEAILQRNSSALADLIAAKKIKKQKNLPEICEDEIPYTLPDNWAWSRLGDLTNYGASDKAEAQNVNPETWVLELEDVEKDTSKLLQKKRFAEREFKSSKNKFKAGDVIYGKLRPYLDKVIVADEDGVCTTEMIPIRAYADIAPEYLRIIMKSPHFKEYANNSTHGMNLPRMGTDKARLAIIPVCSLKEQNIIIKKVHELLDICNLLEKQTDASINAHEILVSTLLKALTDTASSCENGAEKFQQAWERIAAHFDVLFTNENSVDQLKQTILQLAVMGKLVPQDQNEEPASVLLEKIAIEKSQLIKDKKIKKQKPLAAIEDDEKLFKIPEAWTWAKVGNLGFLKGGFAYKSKEFVEDSKHQLIRMGNIRPDFLRINENPVFISEDQALATKDYEIASGDILLTMTGTKGKRDYLYSLKVSTKDLMEKSLYLNQRLCAVRPLVIEPSYINLVLKDDRMLDAIYAKSTGSANQANIGMDAIMNWTIPLPSLQDQRNIVNKVQELWTTCDFLKVKLSKIQSLKLTITDALATVK